MSDRWPPLRRDTTVSRPAGRDGRPAGANRSLEFEADRAAADVVRDVAPPESQGPAGRDSGDIEAVRAAASRRLGHDFGSVRVHADDGAATAARSRDALAFTVGQDVYLDRGALPAEPAGGRAQAAHARTLAHEFAHVAQQAEGRAPQAAQLEPRPRPAAIDADAQRIVDLAAATDRPIAERGPAVVRAIINQYYSGDASKIDTITYSESEPGLRVTYRGTGAQAVGLVTVGRYFVEHTTQTDFARRVSQVRHEIEHVEQQRSGMGGANRSDEREFIAFYHEALSTAPTGAGRMQHSTRVGLIDGALGYYCCLSEDLQRANASRRQELLDRRAEEIRRSGHTDLGDPPTTCRRQGD